MKTLKDIVPEELQSLIKQANEKAKFNDKNDSFHPDLRLFTKWAFKVEEGWYGFSLGESVPMIWTIAIDKVLNYIQEQIPDFKILQIKLKFGGLRFHVDLKMDDCELVNEIRGIIKELETLCSSKNLIY